MKLQISDQREFEHYSALSQREPELFWGELAKNFTWKKSWDKVLEWNFNEPSVQWFINAKLNITENCLDRHLKTLADKTAILWEPNDPNKPSVKITYAELYRKVCKAANMLKDHGVKKGDRVCLYMPMIPELAIAVLACARIGAIHSVVFAGFSANALADRINDAGAKLVLTCDALNRGAKQIPLKTIVDEAVVHCESIQTVIVYNHLQWPLEMKEGRDYWWHEELAKADSLCDAEAMDAEDMLFILYTSGSTGKPKGVVHTCGGYMVYAEYSFRNVFQPGFDDVFWCTADIGWVTGHTYLLYGPLLAGLTTVMFEGVPTHPDAGRFWQIIDKHKINIFYTAPTAIRSLMAAGDDHVLAYNLHSLKTLGSVGEPINEEAWHWYNTHVGKEKCPIADTWWQTETGGIMISALAGIHQTEPAHAGLPLPGIQPVLLDQEGKELSGNNVEGYLCIKFPWPGMIRTTYGDHERCRQTYFDTYKGYYFTGDGAKRNSIGNYRIIGRVDDVINVSGHRFGTAEIENAINQNPHVVESAVVGFPHEIKGQGIFAFVICKEMPSNEMLAKAEITETVVAEIGRIAKPDIIIFVSGLPKTRSGKIMRRILRKIAENDTSNLGDITTLLDPLIVQEIVAAAEKLKR
jgi:acetyl-CoA synthetase